MKHLALVLLVFLAAAVLIGCDDAPLTQAATSASAGGDAELEAARVLLRHERSLIDGTVSPEWPEPGDVRRIGEHTWVVDIDTARLPGGYPEQLVVEVTGVGGHTGRQTHAPGPAVAGGASALAIEVAVEPGEPLCRVTVFLRNPTAGEISFETGARGGPGSLDDRRPPDGVSGTAPTAVPVLTFNESSHVSVVAAPAFGGATRRAMKPATFSVPAGARVVYASFAARQEQVIGRPRRAVITLPDGGRIIADGEKILIGAEAVPPPPPRAATRARR